LRSVAGADELAARVAGDGARFVGAGGGEHAEGVLRRARDEKRAERGLENRRGAHRRQRAGGIDRHRDRAAAHGAGDRAEGCRVGR